MNHDALVLLSKKLLKEAGFEIVEDISKQRGGWSIKPDIIITDGKSKIPVECGNLSLGAKFKKSEDRIIELFKEYKTEKLIHIPYPEEIVLGVPLFRVIYYTWDKTAAHKMLEYKIGKIEEKISDLLKEINDLKKEKEKLTKLIGEDKK